MSKIYRGMIGGENMLKKVSTDKAPAAIGPYSQGIIANGFLENLHTGLFPLQLERVSPPLLLNPRRKTKRN